MLFRFIGGREACEDFFGVPEYVIYPTMVSSTVFTTQVVRGQYSTSYPSFSRTLRQARDLGVWLLCQLGLVERSVRQELLQTLTKLAVHEAHLRRMRRRGDAGGLSPRAARSRSFSLSSATSTSSSPTAPRSPPP